MATAKTPLEIRLYLALKKIAKSYDSATTILKTAEERYGLNPDECLEMAYDNIQIEAREAIRNVRIKRQGS